MSKILGIKILNMIITINIFAETLLRVELVRHVNCASSTGEYLYVVQDYISMS